MKQTILRDLPHYDQLLTSGNIGPIKQWLNEQIHQYGKMKKPLDILKETTGEGLNAQYLISYLEDKYRDVYKLN